MPKMQTLALTFALPPLLGKPGVVRTDWILEGAQRAANDLSDEYAAMKRKEAEDAAFVEAYRAAADIPPAPTDAEIRAFAEAVAGGYLRCGRG